MNYQHILLATDLLDKHIDVAERARVMAHNYQAKLSIAHVVESLPGYASGYSGVIDLEEELYEEAKVKLAEFAGSLNIPTQNQHLGSGNPKIVILDIAEEIDADLIVVGGHNRHGLGLLLGSTAATILHAGHRDVLVVHESKGRKC